MIKFSGKTLSIDKHTLECPHTIVDARLCSDVVVVLFDGQEAPISGVPFRNLWGYSQDGHKLWVAEPPVSGSATEYMEIVSADPLIATSLASYRCQLDPRTGRIIDKEFYK